jgi:hypothetical protein
MVCRLANGVLVLLVVDARHIERTKESGWREGAI